MAEKHDTGTKPQTNKTSAAQLAAAKKWNSKQYRMTLRLSPELKKNIDNHVQARGESVTSFLVRAAREQMARDTAEKPLSK